MKKITILSLVAAFVLFGFSANAQTDQGGWVVGASSSLGFQSLKSNGNSQSQFNIIGKAGYFLQDNIAAGLNLGYSSIQDVVSTTAIGPFARYYFNGTFYAGAGIDFTSVKPNGGNSASGTWINLEAGYPFFLSDNVAFEPNLNFGIGGGDTNKEATRLGLNFGFFLYL